MINKVLKNINKDLKEIEQSSYINSGGCCYFAYLIANELDKRDIKYKVIVDDNHYYTKKYYDYQAKNKKLPKQIFGPFHVYLKIGNYYYDSVYLNTVNRSVWDKTKNFNWTPKQIRLFYLRGKHAGRWNKCFTNNISKYRLNQIKNIIKINFEKYDS